MEGIHISNIQIKGLTPLDFYNNREFRSFHIGDSFSTLVPVYKELLKSVVKEMVNQNLDDAVLTKEQITAIKAIFEKQLDAAIPKRIKTDRPPNKIIEYKGKTYELDLRLNNPVDRNIKDYFDIVSIAEECITQNKPMYISIQS